MKILAYSKWDALPALCGILHFAYVLTLFALFPVAPWWVLLCLGIIYSISVSWNINGISHNFIHNPYFSWRPLNRLFAVVESMTLGFSQTFYKYVHHRHHMGNSDKPDEEGRLADPTTQRFVDHAQKVAEGVQLEIHRNTWRYTRLIEHQRKVLLEYRDELLRTDLAATELAAVASERWAA